MLTRLLLPVLLLLVTAVTPARSAHVVFMIGEDEYKTWETLPVFAEQELKARGHRITIIHADKADKNNFPGLVAALKDADLLFLSVRRRTPRKEQLDAVRAHLAAGKPLVGIRTASHAFALTPKDKLSDAKLAIWQDFDPAVLGGSYSGHHRADAKTKAKPVTRISAAPGASGHPILQGVEVGQLAGYGLLYKASPLAKGTTPLLIGTIPEQPSEPVAWTNTYGPKQARIFYTSLGDPEDFKNPTFLRLLVNSVTWGVGK